MRGKSSSKLPVDSDFYVMQVTAVMLWSMIYM